MFVSPKSEGCTKVHSGSLFFFDFKALQMASYISKCPDAEAVSETEIIALHIGPCSWRLHMFWWTWGLSQVLSSESHLQLQHLNSELFALCQLVLTLRPELWGVTCSHRKGSEYHPWVTLANRKLQGNCGARHAEHLLCPVVRLRWQVHHLFSPFSVYYWELLPCGTVMMAKPFWEKRVFSIVINEGKQGTKMCCIGSCCD